MYNLNDIIKEYKDKKYNGDDILMASVKTIIDNQSQILSIINKTEIDDEYISTINLFKHNFDEIISYKNQD